MAADMPTFPPRHAEARRVPIEIESIAPAVRNRKRLAPWSRLCNPAEVPRPSGNPEAQSRLTWGLSKTRSAPTVQTGTQESAAASIGPPTLHPQRPYSSPIRAAPCPVCRRSRSPPFWLNRYSNRPLASVSVARSARLVLIPAQTQRTQPSTPQPGLRSLSSSHPTSVNAVYAQYTRRVGYDNCC